MSERIDIGQPLRELTCERLGLTYEDVAEIVFRPSTVVAKVYLRDEHGRKHVDEHGQPRCEILTIEVTT